MAQDDTSHSVDDIDIITFECLEDLLMVDPLHDCLGDKEEDLQDIQKGPTSPKIDPGAEIEKVKKKQEFTIPTKSWRKVKEKGVNTISSGVRRYYEVFHEATLEVLSTFEADRSAVSEQSLTAISFQLFEEGKTMSYMCFSMYMGFFNREFIHTREYKELLTAFPEHIITPSRYWLQLGERYRNNKASLMSDLVHRYIHALVSRTIAGRDDSIDIVTSTSASYCTSFSSECPSI
ncbi:hypothetical protein J5N97_028216 [Dioscorea zingiberensis]|uniref:Uncharacterized protein n=1 Tax=Dioscorea zingiberensis TaxID=325984 RepID=A0A9D5H4M3_9LILI|nr:hypothetical protein J5N97_028216 [Dioscorea zingiberensis]